MKEHVHVRGVGVQYFPFFNPRVEPERARRLIEGERGWRWGNPWELTPDEQRVNGMTFEVPEGAVERDAVMLCARLSAQAYLGRN